MSLLSVRPKSFALPEARELFRIVQDFAVRVSSEVERLIDSVAERSRSVVLSDYVSSGLGAQTIGTIHLNDAALGVRTAVGTVTVTARIAAWDANLFQGASYLVHGALDRYGVVSWQFAGGATVSTVGAAAGTVALDVVNTHTLRVRCTPAATPLLWSAEVQFTRAP